MTRTRGLDAFLSPAFTLQRADGSVADKADFIQRPADVLEFTISGLTATQTGDVLVTRYMADVVARPTAGPTRRDPRRACRSSCGTAPNGSWSPTPTSTHWPG
jgi:hypothetical protein